MTLPELLGGIGGAVAAAAVTYKAVTAKLNSLIGAKAAPGDESLRDVVMRIDGKLDAQHEQATEQFQELDRRLELVEARVFTPPRRAAIRPAE